MDPDSAQLPVGEGPVRVPPVPASLLDDNWVVVSAGCWEREEPMPVLEGRALVWALRHEARSASEKGTSEAVFR